MLTRDITFHVIDVPDGQILIRKTGKEFECWTVGNRIDTIINYEFGLPVYDKNREKDDRYLTLNSFIEIVMDNYEDGFLDFDKYYV